MSEFERQRPRLIPDLDKVRMGIDQNRMTALLVAILDHCGGEVTLTKAESERVWDNPSIDYTRTPDGGVTIKLRGWEPHNP